ncbi:MAG: c-type cytochrome [Flavobacteriales bacterium]
MLRICALFLILLIAFGFSAYNRHEIALEINANSYLSDVLIALGDQKPLHHTESRRDAQLIQKGKEIIFTGQTTDSKGNKTKRQSKHFTCTHCHNTVKEDPNPEKPDPEARLTHAAKNNFPFLPGSTFYGMVNRVSWYNGDYLSKYGDLVKPARDTLKNAIHLCAVECSQGRALESWEMDAVLAYFYSIEFKLVDLSLTEKEIASLNEAVKLKSNSETIAWLKQKYYVASPATFLDPIAKNERKAGVQGNAENGKYIYELSCMHCHKLGGVTNFILDNEKITFRFLKSQFNTTYHFSIYDKVRKGTYALNGYKPYMPNYTLERMSHQQLEDLAAYITQQAKR